MSRFFAGAGSDSDSESSSEGENEFTKTSQQPTISQPIVVSLKKN